MKKATHKQKSADNSSTEKFLPLFPPFSRHHPQTHKRPQNGKIFLKNPSLPDEMGKN